MDLHILNREEMRDVYSRFMVKDFPEDELKTLEMIERLMGEGRYLCLGIMENRDLCGYGILVYDGANRQDNAQSRRRSCLLDYLAIRKDRRGEGLGSAFLQETMSTDWLTKDGSVQSGHYLVEVEDPDFAANENERLTRKRRIDFYRRNGFADTGIRVRLYGVELWILDRDSITGPDDAVYLEEVRRLYIDIYEYVLGKATAAENLIVH